MTQLGSGLDLSTKRARTRQFLEEMRHVMPWVKLVSWGHRLARLDRLTAARRSSGQAVARLNIANSPAALSQWCSTVHPDESASSPKDRRVNLCELSV